VKTRPSDSRAGPSLVCFGSSRKWIASVQVEVKIRFLLVGKTNVKPDKILLDIAENILLYVSISSTFT
jgi:hypothetical protein